MSEPDIRLRIGIGTSASTAALCLRLGLCPLLPNPNSLSLSASGSVPQKSAASVDRPVIRLPKSWKNLPYFCTGM